MQNKTFRLFISSTFSDFNEERKLLQTIVFPEIKKYCRKNNLNFQPIDLRWGVTEEASNDQKTLELCLEEVQSSKLHPYPNFLIMLGDRYGTIILPYMIKKNEFESIFNLVEKYKRIKKLLATWYKLDVNQIPASYIIQQRKDANHSYNGIDYTDRKNWKPINQRLIKIFQTIVPTLNLEEEKKRKYFISATEAEVVEGVFKFLDKTPKQIEKLKENPNIEDVDYENVYAYIRNIDSIDNLKEKFIDVNSDDVKRFKSNLKAAIKKENICNEIVNLTDVTQDQKTNSLNYKYEQLENTFVSQMKEYLKSSVDRFLKEFQDNLTVHELELQEQEKFKKDKVDTFLKGSRTNALDEIKNYIDGKNNKPLVIYGKSGLGKSSLMAKAIDKAIKQYSKERIIYRFVGAISSLNNSPSLLISILRDLGINEEIKKTINPQTGEEKNEKLEEFYLRIHDHLLNITDKKVIFIDAVDQLSNKDEFLWLPNELKNLKIVITVLKDVLYKDTDGAIYFQNLQRRTDNIYSLEPFENSKCLVKKILSRYDRSITKDQMDYLLSQSDSNSPLYLTVATQEVKHWKAESKKKKRLPNQNLAPTQKQLIKEYIENLTKLYHHNYEFVKRVFSYLYLTDGLSESELIEILNIDLQIDEKFEKQVASDENHVKEIKELPIVIWARLYSHMKEFLKFEQKDNKNTMNFFHREFNDVIKSQENLKEVHEHLIDIFQNLITKYQNKRNILKNWEKKYEEVLILHNLFFKDNDYLKKSVYFYAKNKGYGTFYTLFSLDNNIDRYKKVSQERFRKYFAEYLYENEVTEIALNLYKQSLSRLSYFLKQVNEFKEAEHYDNYVYEIEKKRFGEYRPKDYVLSINNKAGSLIRSGNYDFAISILEETLEYGKLLIKQGNFEGPKLYVILISNLVEAYLEKKDYNHKYVSDLLIEAEEIGRKLSIKNKYALLAISDQYINFLAAKEETLIEALDKSDLLLAEGLFFFRKNDEKYLETFLDVLESIVDLYMRISNETFIERTSNKKFNNRYELILNIISIALNLIDEHIIPQNKSFFLDRKVFFLYLKIKCKLELKDESANDDFEKLQNLILEHNITNANHYVDDLETYKTNPSFENINNIVSAHDKAMNEIVKVVFFCEKNLPFEDILIQARFTKSTPYDVVKVEENSESVLELVLGKKVKVPCLVYYFEGEIEETISLVFEENPNDANIFDLIAISKFIAFQNNENEISGNIFVTALSFFELNEESKKEFSQITHLDLLPKESNGKEILNLGYQLSNMPFSNEFKNIAIKLIQFFEKIPIGTLR